MIIRTCVAVAFAVAALGPAIAGGCVGKAKASPAAMKTQAKSDIVQTAASAGQFNTLLAAATAAGLVDTLRGEGPFTVFAPTDAAFARLPAGTVESLLKPENRSQLRAILTYHVVPGVVTARDLSGKLTAATTVQGARVSVDGRQGVTVNNATVTTPDIATSNGVIHVIDRVLLPPPAHGA